jgi:hypothetical protein
VDHLKSCPDLLYYRVTLSFHKRAIDVLPTSLSNTHHRVAGHIADGNVRISVYTVVMIFNASARNL